jgi:glutathionyl-hydroquinone reductase
LGTNVTEEGAVHILGDMVHQMVRNAVLLHIAKDGYRGGRHWVYVAQARAWSKRALVGRERLFA